jgi:hypothetical protein
MRIKLSYSEKLITSTHVLSILVDCKVVTGRAYSIYDRSNNVYPVVDLPHNGVLDLVGGQYCFHLLGCLQAQTSYW